MKLFKQIMARIIFLPLILAAGIAVTGLFTLRIMFKPEDLEAIVTNQFQEILKRPVHIEWARLSATGEIKIKGIRVTEPGPETVDFLRAEYIYATCRLLPLLKRRIEIDSVVLVSPRIELIKRADGTWNAGDIFASYRKSSGKSILNKIDEAEIKDGEVSVRYMESGARHSFDNFNLTLRDFKPGADTPFSASVFFKSNAFRRPVRGRLYTEGTVNFAGFDWEEASVKGLRADLTLLDKTAKFTGGIKNFRTPRITLRANTPSFKSGDLAYLFSSPMAFTAPRSSWEIDAVFTSSGTAELGLLTRPLNIKAEGSFDLSKSTLSYAFTISAPPFSLDQVKRYGSALHMDDLSGKAQLRLKLVSKNGKPSLSRIFINTSGAGFKYRGLTASGLDLAALLSENFANSYATASGGKLTLGGGTLSGLKLKTEIAKDWLLFNYSGKFNSGPVKGRAVVRNPFTAKRTVDFTGYSADLLFSELKNLVLDIKEVRGPRVGMPEVDSQLVWLKTLKNSIPIGYSSVKLLYQAGHFKHEYMDAADFYVSAALKNIAGDISGIKGDISIKSGSGTFYDVQKTSEQDRIFYIFSMPLRFIFEMNRRGALKFGSKVNDVSFNSIGGDYTLSEGKVEIKNFYMDGKEFSATASGQLDFSNETMSVKIYTISGKYDSMGSLPEALTDASGKPALAFIIEGKMTKPEFKMISPKESGKFIKEAALKGVAIDFARINSFSGGKQ
ncbi:MAG: AsmA-like C-terminal region-containing protein [Elusimicrobiota bacterium]|nr:AsmA-like C-terminal region-containing protein [Elusimicrobiota bacterium]